MSIDRRTFLACLPSFAAVPRLIAQPAPAQIRVRGINHVSLSVTDIKRSIDFYQGLFGMPARRESASNVALSVGSGPEHLGLSTGAAPTIDHYCLGVDGFDADRIVKVLADHGVSKSDTRGGLKVQVTRGPAGIPSIHMGDPDGVDVQLQDAAYCGGAGCIALEPSPKKGLIALKGYSHLTIFATDAARSNAFYKDLFGFGIRSYQGPTAPTLAVGPGVEFVMFTGGGGRGAAPKASINHFCMTVENFDADQIIKTLESYGIKPRESQTGPVAPLRHYISMRMENRGGAKEGTPELYFTDPDGILVQLQDTKYCGGSGRLGEICSPL